MEQRQDNQVRTTEEGRYQWMAPSGWWKVCYEKDGYQTAWSKPMNLPPIHTAVDVGLLSIEAPKAKISIQADGSVNVLFTSYMQLESSVSYVPDANPPKLQSRRGLFPVVGIAAGAPESGCGLPC